ncbi:MAG: sigma-70 family RNA polymerase sigma factor [Parabacteroides sp.]|nr:sigma-70 family RNA polymerase sigma factor [Parabacteroides sp.]
MYHQRQGQSEPDVLRARFTNWIEKLIKNAKIDYIRQLNKAEPEFVSIDELFEDEQLIGARDVVISEDKDSFDFQEERLAEAFYKLPLMKRKILELLFIECIKPEEIASRLNCSSDYVYLQRKRAINKLRKELSIGGNEK